VPDEIADVKAKYAAERLKRLRSDGVRQYQTLSGEFAHLDKDPYTPDMGHRQPLEATNEVVLIGGGLTNVIMGSLLDKAGFHDVRIIERAGDLGGVWYWNRYPGVMCDVESYVYMPLLEDLGYVPTERYASGAEIRTYLQSLARHHGLYEQALLSTRVVELRWDDVELVWTILTDRGDTVKARFVVLGLGSTSLPKLPRIPGLNKFKGRMFHTSRWDNEYTGGDERGGLDKLAEKTVGVIGTGATAIQCVPHLAEAAQHLYIFQRTPAAVDVRDNRPTDPVWAAGLTPGWQRERIENFDRVVEGLEVAEDLVMDGWTATFAIRHAKALETERGQGEALTDEERQSLLELADLELMETIRERVSHTVRDPALAELLKPWFKRFCKRPCFHDEYLDVFNRQNVTLVDTNGRGVNSVDENGVIVDGVHYPLDCLVLSTGFEAGMNYLRRGGFNIFGRDGMILNDKWDAGFRTFHGMHSHGFPNLFTMGVTQTGLSGNYTNTVLGQAEHIAYVLSEMRRRDVLAVEAELDAENAFVAEIHQSSAGRDKYFADCTPSYMTNEGDLKDPRRHGTGVYPKGATAFFELLAEWRKDGRMAGLSLRSMAGATHGA
jgi:cyclohexanone monooxygenase